MPVGGDRGAEWSHGTLADPGWHFFFSRHPEKQSLSELINKAGGRFENKPNITSGQKQLIIWLPCFIYYFIMLRSLNVSECIILLASKGTNSCNYR